MIKQFLSDVSWEELDYLVIDTPPGTSDEHISVVEVVKQQYACTAILVTTPQVYHRNILISRICLTCHAKEYSEYAELDQLLIVRCRLYQQAM